MKKIYLILLFFFLHPSVHADIPHYLDFKYVLNESTAGKKAQDTLKKRLDKELTSLKQKKSLQEEEKKIIQQKKIIK